MFAQYQGKPEAIPVEILLKAKPHRRKRYTNEDRSKKVRTTESIISEKVKKYLTKLFGGSTRLRDFLDKSTSMTSTSIQVTQEEAPAAAVQTGRVTFPDVFPKYQPVKMRPKWRKPTKYTMKIKNESLNNLYLQMRPSATSEDLKTQSKSSFTEMVDELIKKQKKKHGGKTHHKKLKKTTKSSTVTLCDRAKLFTNTSFATDDTVEETQDVTQKDTEEEILNIQDLNNYEVTKTSSDSVTIKNICQASFKSIEFQSRCSKKTSNSTKLHHHSSLSLNFLANRDFEADLELWTSDYINGLVAVHERFTEKPNTTLSKIPVKKKKSKAVKTNTKTGNVKNELKNLTDFGQAHLLGGVRTMEGTRKLNQIPKCKTNKLKCKTDDYLCQKMQDIQNYINNLIPPERKCGELGVVKQSQKQSIQELKKFQRELKSRIKELEKKMPSTSSASPKDKLIKSASNHELSFLNLSKFLDDTTDNKPKVINKVRYCTKKNSFNLKMKFGDKFCECCFLDAKKIPNDMCRRCNKKVYLVERICAGEGVYHNFCYSCYFCKRNLNSLNLCVTRGEIFCKQCFNKYFGPEMYGFIK